MTEVLEDRRRSTATGWAGPAPVHPLEANGGIVAALLAAAAACALLGALTVATEASPALVGTFPPFYQLFAAGG